LGGGTITASGRGRPSYDSAVLAAIFGRGNLYGIGPRAALVQHPTPYGAPLAVQRGIGIAREPDSARKRVSWRLMDNPG